MTIHLSRPTILSKWNLPLLVINLFIINLGLSISSFPSTKLWQDIICKQTLGLSFDELLPESECHGYDVQRELNIVDIGLSVSSTLGGAFVSLPLGIAADKVGRVPILALSILSLFLSEGYQLLILQQWRHVPIRAIWGAGAILALGGGQSIAEVMVFTSISDVMSEARRATCFQWAVGAVLLSQLVAPFIAAQLIRYSIWHPLYIELGFIAFGGLSLALFMPETLPAKVPSHTAEDGSITAADITATNTICRKTTLSTLTLLKTLFRRQTLFLIPGSILSVPIATTQNNIVNRLTPIQFNWSLRESSYLGALSALITLITLLLLLPVVSYYILTRHALTLFQRDRILARASVLLFMLGSVLLMIVNDARAILLGVIISSLGSGVPTLCRSLLVALHGKHNTGSMFGILAAGEVLGLLVCELVSGALFDAGLNSWMRLPFCLGLAGTLIISASTWLARVGEVEKGEDASEHSESQTGTYIAAR